MKVKYTLLTILLISLAILGCDKDDNVQDCGQVGTWCPQPPSPIGCLFTYEFKSNGDFLITSSNIYNYTIEGSCEKIIITPKQDGVEGRIEWDIIYIEEDKMKLDYLNGSLNDGVFNGVDLGIWYRVE